MNTELRETHNNVNLLCVIYLQIATFSFLQPSRVFSNVTMDVFLEVVCDLATKILMIVAICCHSSTYLVNIQNKENKKQNFPLGYDSLEPKVAVGLFWAQNTLDLTSVWILSL